MNGYYARVQAYRRRLAAADPAGAPPPRQGFDWLMACVEGFADAVHMPGRRKWVDDAADGPRDATQR